MRLYIDAFQPLQDPRGIPCPSANVPTYEFRCPAGHDFERFFKTMSAAPSELDCPECGALASRQLSGGGGLLFKGSGFYLTDYGKNAHRKSAPDAKSGAGGEGGAKDGAKDGVKDTARGGAGGESKSDASPKPDSSRKDSSKADSVVPKPGPKPKSE